MVFLCQKFQKMNNRSLQLMSIIKSGCYSIIKKLLFDLIVKNFSFGKKSLSYCPFLALNNVRRFSIWNRLNNHATFLQLPEMCLAISFDVWKVEPQIWQTFLWCFIMCFFLLLFKQNVLSQTKHSYFFKSPATPCRSSLVFSSFSAIFIAYCP